MAIANLWDDVSTEDEDEDEEECRVCRGNEEERCVVLCGTYFYYFLDPAALLLRANEANAASVAALAILGDVSIYLDRIRLDYRY
jgi:hypothetical protein